MDLMYAKLDIVIFTCMFWTRVTFDIVEDIDTIKNVTNPYEIGPAGNILPKLISLYNERCANFSCSCL